MRRYNYKIFLINNNKYIFAIEMFNFQQEEIYLYLSLNNYSSYLEEHFRY